MEVNNEIRRLKIKLKLFEEEGFNWVVDDMFRDNFGISTLGYDTSEEYLKEWKKKYLLQLKHMLPKDNKQGKLEL